MYSHIPLPSSRMEDGAQRRKDNDGGYGERPLASPSGIKNPFSIGLTCE